MDNYRNGFHTVIEQNKQAIDTIGDQGLIVNRWLYDPYRVAPVPHEQRLIAWALLIAAMIAACGAAVLLFRHRAGIWSAVKSAIAAIIIVAVRFVRHLRAEASDIRTQVAHALDQPDRYEKNFASPQDSSPGRLRLAGRMFFNLAIAPLLLAGVLIVVAVLASRLGFLD